METNPDEIYAVIGEFETPEALVEAVWAARREGYRKLDALSPFPIHGIDEALGHGRSRLGYIAAAMGFFGAMAALLLQWWTGAVDYPLVIGGKPRDTQALVDLFDQHSRCRKPYPIGQCDLIAAGVLKYMENAYLALKVTFMNQMYDVLKASGSHDEWNHVAEIFHLDPRMGTSHYQVPGPDGDRGWGGKCFPKDINALIHYCRRIGVDCDLMEKAWEINKRLRKDWDWAKIPGAVSAKKDKPAATRRRTAGA